MAKNRGENRVKFYSFVGVSRDVRSTGVYTRVKARRFFEVLWMLDIRDARGYDLDPGVVGEVARARTVEGGRSEIFLLFQNSHPGVYHIIGISPLLS
jgi:hypothetical protein